MPFYPPIRGDGSNQVERFVLAGVTATYSLRGKLFGSLTATTVKLYRDVERASGDEVATGTHASPTTWTKISLTAVNTSGITGSVYVKFTAADATWEVYALLNTDSELAVERIDIDRYPKTAAASTFEAQHKKAVEDFVRLMQQRVSPQPGRAITGGGGSPLLGTLRGDVSSPWRVNSVGDYELVRLQNVDAYRQWALHHTLAMIFRTVNRLVPDNETQLRVIEEETELASKAWAETIPLIDADDDMDADREVLRFRIARA